MGYSLDELLRSEERHKEAVYSEFDRRKRDANESVRHSEAWQCLFWNGEVNE